MTSAHDPLLQSLDRYIGRQLLRQVVWGLLRSVAVLGALWLGLVIVEGQLWLLPSLRTALLLLWVVLALGLIGLWVGRPMWQHSRMSPEQRRLAAGRELGARLPPVADKLLNLLQLYQIELSPQSLAAADRAQRVEALGAIPYLQQVPWRTLRRPALAVGAVLVVALCVALVWPEQVGGGHTRLTAPGRTFLPPPPYRVQIEQMTEPVVQGEAFELVVRAEGRALPERLEFYAEGAEVGVPLTRESDGRFRLELPRPERSFTFELGTSGYRTARTAVRVLRRPRLADFRLTLRYPPHTGLKAERLGPYVGDATVPAGTVLSWQLVLADSAQRAELVTREGRGAFTLRETGALFSRQVLRDLSYRLSISGVQGLQAADSQSYAVTVIADRAPTVVLVAPEAESLLPPGGITPVQAQASDDYGIAAAWLLYRAEGAQSDSAIRRKALTINSSKEILIDQAVDWLELGLKPGGTWQLAIEVEDNDAVTGPKRSRTPWHRLRHGSRLEAIAETQAQADSVGVGLGAALDQAEQVKAELERLRREALEGKPLDFDTRRRLEQLERQQQRLNERLQEADARLSELRQESADQQTSSPQQQEELSRVQEQLRQLTSPKELSEFLKALREQEERLDSRNLFRQLEQLERTGRYQQSDLQRMRQLLEQWREKQAREAQAQRAEALRQRQQALESLTREAQTPEQAQQLAEQQRQLAEQAERLARELERAKANGAQEQPSDQARPDSSGSPSRPDSARQVTPPDTNAGQPSSAPQTPSERGRDAQQQMQRATQRLQQNQPRQARPNQQRAADQLQQLADALRQDQNDAELEQATENYEDLRALTENLLKLSFDQEEVQAALRRVRANDPALKQKSATQQRLRDDMGYVEDSLEALAGRVPQIKQELLDRTRRITANLDDALESLDERQIAQAGVYQQKARTDMNALASLLVDALNQVQMQMRAAQNRRGKPRQGSPGSLRELAEQQQQLGNEMGEQPQDGAQAERLRALAERQAEIRQQLQQLYQKLKQEGEQGLGSLDKVAEDMQQNEADLRAAELSRQTLLRQQQILSRMLDYDKAMREREYEERRTSRTGQGTTRRVGGRTPDAPEGRPGPDALQRRRLTYSPAQQQLIDRYFLARPAR